MPFVVEQRGIYTEFQLGAIHPGFRSIRPPRINIMKRRTLLHSLAATSATLALPAFAQAERRIVLGQSAAFSGPAAYLGTQMNRGAKIYFDSVNAAGGVNGSTIELRTLDDGYEPDRCKANTERFVNKDNVFGLFGYVGTPTCVAAMPVIQESRTIFFGPFTGAESLREPFSKNIFHVRASYFDETALIVKQLTSLGLKRIAVFYQDDAYGKAGLEGVSRALKALSLSPVATGTVQRNTVEVATAVKTIAAANPEAVVQITAYKSSAAFIREARKAGYGGTFYNVSFVGTQALADELGREARGIMISQVMPSPFSATAPLSREYLEAVAKAGGDANPNYSSMEGYVAARLFTEGLKRAGRNPTRESFITAMESIQNLNLGGFNVNFGARDHVASHFVELSMLTEDGKVRR
jgi:branched-chain amino acid transport system substrate-binding protein